MSNRKSIHIRFFDNPMDEVIRDWLDDVPNRQNGGKTLVVKKALAEHAQRMGYHLPEPTPTKKKAIKVISAPRRAEREALEAKQDAEIIQPSAAEAFTKKVIKPPECKISKKLLQKISGNYFDIRKE